MSYIKYSELSTVKLRNLLSSHAPLDMWYQNVHMTECLDILLWRQNVHYIILFNCIFRVHDLFVFHLIPTLYHSINLTVAGRFFVQWANYPAFWFIFISLKPKHCVGQTIGFQAIWGDMTLADLCGDLLGEGWGSCYIKADCQVYIISWQIWYS